MCGIVGAVAERSVDKILLQGLKRLEYRGYDSAGITLLDQNLCLNRLRVLGKVGELEKALMDSEKLGQFIGNTGIAHTRWATHGVPSERNAHPFVSHDEFALVHNGIIENHEELREELLSYGYHFTSDTDSEVIVHYIHYQFHKKNDLLEAVRTTILNLQGSYALALISKKNPHRLIAVRHGSPLVVGKGIGENFIASDVLAMLPVAKEFIYLEDHDIADITKTSIDVYGKNRQKIIRKMNMANEHYDVVERGEHRHYMRKEIADQSEAVATCLEGRVVAEGITDTMFGLTLKKKLPDIAGVHLVACGTSYHAALIGKYWIEELTGVPASVEIASEYRYRKPVVPKKTLFITLSQSGETADMLGALRWAKNLHYSSTLAICNVPESTLTREADHVFLMRAGMEIGVASTKAFTNQLVSLLLFSLVFAKSRNVLQQETEILNEIQKLPELFKKVTEYESQVRELSQKFMNKAHALFLARGKMFPIALEGALKLKEISYIHAEGYPGGELKHGALALVDKNMPVVALAPKDELFDKIKSNLAEVQARGGEIFVITDAPEDFNGQSYHIIAMPKMHPLIMPILYTLPLQLLAYHVAVLKGTDVDQPRNLAKSVTVE